MNLSSALVEILIRDVLSDVLSYENNTVFLIIRLYML